MTRRGLPVHNVFTYNSIFLHMYLSIFITSIILEVWNIPRVGPEMLLLDVVDA